MCNDENTISIFRILSNFKLKQAFNNFQCLPHGSTALEGPWLFSSKEFIYTDLPLETERQVISPSYHALFKSLTILY